MAKSVYEQLEPYMKGHLSECRFKGAPLDVCDCVEIRMLARIEKLQKATNQSRLAFAGMVSVSSAVRLLDGLGDEYDG